MRLLTPPHPHLANSLNNVGWLCLNMGWLKTAEAPLKSALEMWKDLFGPKHSEVTNTLSILAKLYRRTKRQDADAGCLKTAATARDFLRVLPF